MANLEGISVTAYIQTGTGDDIEWNYVTSATTEADGSYDLAGLPAGTYRIKFNDPESGYLTEYYSDAVTLDTATSIAVAAATTVTGKNAILGVSSRIQGTVTDS